MPAVRAKAEKMVKSKAAALLVVSPMRAPSSRFQALDAKRTGPGKIEEMLEYGMNHFKFTVESREIQRRRGWYFMCQRPSSASSGSTGAAQRMLRHVGGKVYEGDARQFGMQQTVNGEPLFIKKRTKFVTNARYVGKELSQQCKVPHRRVELAG